MVCHGSTQTSPYEYGHHAVLPWELQSSSRRVTLQNDLKKESYKDLMMDELEDLHLVRLRALENIEKNKLCVAKYYNKVRVKQFEEGDLVWKAILLIGMKDRVWYVVSKLGRTFSDSDMCTWQCIYFEDFAIF
jgi:hypothetical protein